MHFHKKFFTLFVFTLCLTFAWQVHSYSKKRLDKPNKAQIHSTIKLKEYMSHFGSLVAGMEILRYKEKKTDWEAIRIMTEDMKKTLEKMQQADPEGRYQDFTQILKTNLQEIEKWSEKKKRSKTYEAFDQLTGTCFACHAVHRPSDFFLPKPNDPRKAKSKP